METFDGLVLVDKPEGLTSHDVVNKVRRLFNTRSVGHAGTLDPMATGLLVLMVGEATKLSDYILSGDKVYHAEILLGLETDTGDITGQVVKKADAPTRVDQSFGLPPAELDSQLVKGVVEKLRGPLLLPVPSFSAVKVAGKKLYEMARHREAVPRVERDMNFFLVEFLAWHGDHLEIRLGCEKGGYVRSWATELGHRLTCGATVAKLRREVSTPYSVQDAMTLESLESHKIEKLERGVQCWWSDIKACIPLHSALPNVPSLAISHRDEKLMRNGSISDALRVQLRVSPRVIGAPYVKIISQETHQLISILQARQPAGFSIRRVFKQTSKMT